MATAKHIHKKHFHWGNVGIVLAVAAILIVSSLLRSGSLHLVPDPRGDEIIGSYSTPLESFRSEDYFSDLVIEPADSGKQKPSRQDVVVPSTQPMNDLNAPKQSKQPSAASTKDSMLVSFTQTLNDALHQKLSVMARTQAQVAGAEASKPIEPIRGWTKYPIRLGQ